MLTRTPARIWGALAAALLCSSLPRAAHAIGETTGQISGYVYDPTGAALSEVPISISGPALLEGRTISSGDDGRYVFNNLPPGSDYALVIDVPGFTKINLTGLTVVLGLTTTNDIHLEVATEQAAPAGTIEVVERVNPILNPDSAQAVAVIDAEKAAETPIFHQVEGMAQQVAGVGQGTTPVTRGGLSRYGHFFIDGLDTTDISVGSITAPMNFDAVQNFEIITGAMDAQYNSMGMVTNAVTKSGSNRYTWDVNFTFEPAFLAAQNQYPTNTPPGFGLYYNPVTQAPQTSFYSPVVNFGGPIIKDKLWFYASYQQNFSAKDVPISQLGTQYNRETDTTTSLGRIKLTWQATSNDKLSLGLNLDRNVINNDQGNSFVTNAAENKIHRGGEFVLLNYDHSFSDTTLFQLQTGFTFEQTNTDPIYSDYLTPNHYDIDTGVDSQNADAISFGTIAGNFLHETKWDLQFNPSMSWTAHALGTHQFKAGVQVAYQIDKQITGVSGNERYTDRGGTCDPTNAATFAACYEQTTFYNNQNQEAALNVNANALKLGIFVQDKWTVSRRLTILPGMRADVGYLYGNSSNLLATLAGLGPRLGFTYDLLGDRKTLVVAHYGRSNDTGDVFIAQHANPSLEQVTSTFNTSTNTFPVCPSTPPMAGATQTSGCTYTGGTSAYNFVTHNTALFSNIAQQPYMDELSGGIHTQLIADTVFGLDYTYRYYGDMWADQEVNRIWSANGEQVLGYVNGVPQTIFKTAGYDSAYRQYNGADIWVQGTPGRWDLLASYTLSFTNGTVDNYFDGYLNNPRMTQYYQGYLQSDNRHALKGSVAYKTPIGLDIGFRFTFYTGSPNWEGMTNPGDTTEKVYFSPRGTGFPVNSATGLPNFNNPYSIAQFRNPDELLLNLQLRYNLGELLKLKASKLELTFFVVNMLNNEQPYVLNQSYTAKLPTKVGTGEFYESPLQGEFILRYRN